MDSKRRMMELHVWDRPFFSQLSQRHKLFYWFVLCKCDNVGVYQHNPRLAAFHCDGDIDLEAFVETVNFDQERIDRISNGMLWIKHFVRDTWGTLAAGNNLGASCYKLLVKHELLSRFISEQPNAINVASFREYILEEKKGYADLPLPQSSPNPAPENGVYEEYEGQASPRAGTINNTITIKGSIINLDSIKKHLPLKKIDLPDHVVEADLQRVFEGLAKQDLPEGPEALVIEMAKSFDFEEDSWETFINTFVVGHE